MAISLDFLPFKNPPNIAVIGDICLDLYYFTGNDGAEVSVETGLQSFSVYKTREDLGGAGNVAANCASLGAATVDLYGIAGNDPWGKILIDLAKARNIGTEGILIQNEAWQTHVYHKIFNGKEELPRYDMGNQNVPSVECVDKLIGHLKSRLAQYRCVIINEQVPSGLHSQYFRERLCALIDSSKDSVMWFSDCRRFNDVYNNTVRKLNINEAVKLLKTSDEPGKPSACYEPALAAARLHKRWGFPVALTLGEDGALLCDDEGCHAYNGLHFTGQIDSVGAGDAFLAGLVTARGAGLSYNEAMLAATFSAGVSLGKIGETGHPSQREVLALAIEADFRYNSVLARDESLAQYYFSPKTGKNSDIEIISNDVFKRIRGKPRAAIFDHDGTISVLRQGWEEIMTAVMINAVLGGNAGRGVSNSVSCNITDVKNAVSALIEKTTGIQTLAQMYALKDLVLSFGFVNPADVLSPAEYKEIYNQKLLASMEKRLDGIKTGRLCTDDVTIKGAVSFLKKLAAAGVRLFLASGTDEEDVKNEAALLGYAAYFTGGIRGSVGDIKNDPKKIVIRNIIGEFKSESGSAKSADNGCVIVFGDGPVEMREAKKAGLPAIGVLSDERRRFGRNPEKRERLVLAGADALIPDFSCIDELCCLLGWNKL